MKLLIHGKLLTLLLVLCMGVLVAACVDTGPYVLRSEEATDAAAPAADDAANLDVDKVVTEEGAAEAADLQPVDEASVDVTDEEAALEDDEVVPAELDLAQSLFRASFLIGREVEDMNGQDIGNVDDFVVEPETGRIRYVVINYGGFLDIGETEIALPLAALAWNAELELAVTLEEALLESLPALDDTWRDAPEAGWDTEIAVFWQEQGLWDEVEAAELPVSVERIFTTQAGTDGTLIGVVDDVLLDLGSGEARYIAIFADPSFWNQNDELIVPFSMLETLIVGDDVVSTVNVDVDQFEQAPLMDRSIFLTVDIFESSFVEELDAFWEE